MLETIFSQLAPHYCLSCGEIGSQICNNCFFDIELTPRQTCFNCHGLLSAQTCRSCHELHSVTQLILSSREGLLERLVDDYKFRCTKETYKLLARLLDAGLSYLPDNAVFVPLPTSAAHIRRRGFDHTRDTTRELARLRGLTAKPLLRRRHNHAQYGASVSTRRRNANTAYELSGRHKVEEDTVYIVVDDIVTTGASMEAAIQILHTAGAQHIVAAALLQQPWK